MTQFLRGVAMITTLIAFVFAVVGDFRTTVWWLAINTAALWMAAVAREYP